MTDVESGSQQTESITVGFFTDPTLCIGCKACEVACKEWNRIPHDGFDFKGFSYDHTGSLGDSSWRHVKFLEVDAPAETQDEGGSPAWLFLSDVCKHCHNAGCLEACPTGAIVRTEIGSVFVQKDVCNGCGYCIVTCPFGVIDRRPPNPSRQPAIERDEAAADAGGAFKCTFCYDRQRDGLVPACAKVCPTESIQFGPLDELQQRAARRVEELTARGYDEARLYDPRDTSVRGIHAFFLLLGDAEGFGLPPRPESPTVYLRGSWYSAVATTVALFLATLTAFLAF